MDMAFAQSFSFYIETIAKPQELPGKIKMLSLLCMGVLSIKYQVRSNKCGKQFQSVNGLVFWN